MKVWCPKLKEKENLNIRMFDLYLCLDLYNYTKNIKICKMRYYKMSFIIRRIINLSYKNNVLKQFVNYNTNKVFLVDNLKLILSVFF